MSGTQQQLQIDPQASYTLTLSGSHWQGIIGIIRTASGPGITLDFSLPLLLALQNGLQQAVTSGQKRSQPDSVIPMVGGRDGDYRTPAPGAAE